MRQCKNSTLDKKVEMKRVLIIGAGGHGQVVADILLTSWEAGAQMRPVGFVDDATELQNHILLGLPVIGKIECYKEIDFDEAIVAIGSNTTRSRLFDVFQMNGVSMARAIHPSAIIGKEASIGPGSVVCAGVVVNTGSRIGSNVILNTASSVDHHNVIEDHVHIAPGSHTGGDVHIGAGALIGIGAIVMPQRRVGAWSVVGAGALVHEDVLEGRTVIGIPAKERSLN